MSMLLRPSYMASQPSTRRSWGIPVRDGVRTRRTGQRIIASVQLFEAVGDCVVFTLLVLPFWISGFFILHLGRGGRPLVIAGETNGICT